MNMKFTRNFNRSDFGTGMCRREWMIKGGVLAGLVILFVLFEKLSLVIAAGAFLLLALTRLWAGADFPFSRRPVGRSVDNAVFRARNRFSVQDSVDGVGIAAASVSGALPTDIDNVLPLNVNLFAPAWDSVENFLQAILGVIQTRFEFQTANIFLRGHDGGTLIQRACISNTSSVARLATIRVGHGLVGWVAENKRPLLVSNLNHEGRSIGYYRKAGEKVVSFAAAPVMIEGNVVGVISLDHDKAGAFPTPQTEEALIAISGLLAQALGAEEMLAMQSQELEKSLAARSVVQAVYDAPDIDEAASVVVQQINGMTEFHSVSCYLVNEEGNFSRRASIGFNGIEGIHCKEPVTSRAAVQAVRQGSMFRLDGAALGAQYRANRTSKVAVPDVLLAFPIFHKGEAIGALVVEVFSAINLNEQLIEIIEEISGSLGRAFLRVYHSAVAAVEAKVEAELIRFSAELLDARSADEVWSKVFKRVLDKLDGTGVVVYRKGESEFRLESVAGCTPTQEVIPFNTTLVGWAALAGRPVVGLKKDRRPAPIKEGAAYLACPIGFGDSLHSVLIAVVDEPATLTFEIIEWARQLFEVIQPILRKADQMERAAASIEHDPLTGFFNADGLRRRTVMLASNGDAAVLFLRIDNYEHLLGQFGRAEVERFLKKFASILELDLEPGTFAARIEGGRFAFARKNDVAALKDSISEKLRTSAVDFLNDIPVSYSISWAHTREQIRAEELMLAAESRLSLLEKRVTTVANVA